MKLQLQYKKSGHHEVAAVCIWSNTINTWLDIIKKLGIPLEEIVAYPIPASIQKNEVAGLFLIIPAGKKFDDDLLLERYTKFGSRLFIPLNSMLYPSIEVPELEALLLWEVQVFHPVAGLFGFEYKDRLDFRQMLGTPNFKCCDWGFAGTGLTKKPGLNRIAIQQPAIEDVLQSFKEEINTKDLEEIGSKNDENFLSKMLNEVFWFFLKASLFSTGFLYKLFGSGPNNHGNLMFNKPGILQEFRQWLEQNIADLEKKRGSELNRLLKMFDENTDKALQYAIPLDSPYFNRGSTGKTANLIKRSLNFNLRKLGGGSATDTWDVSSHYNDLRRKYLHVAEKELKQKDYRKAAYVYAHLLGDFSSAANVLEQGKFYREAAAIHRDHFKNTKAAAYCLERGGLYDEAIPLYEDLEEFEKIGDLFRQLSQSTNSNQFYQKAAAIKLNNGDYLDAARISEEKLYDIAGAKEILVDGWNDYRQSEQCLDKYFQLVLSTEADKVEDSVKEIYQHKTPASKRLNFLNVLNKVNQKTGETNKAYREIAYEIISCEAESGNMLSLHNLKQFIRKDRLLSGDCSRYINSGKRKQLNYRSEHLLYLDQTIKWITAAVHRNQFIAIGSRDNMLHLARGNWYGNLEYYSWTNSLKPATRFTLTLSQFYSNHIFLQASNGFLVSHKKLAKNKYFNDTLFVHNPVWLHKDRGQFVINEREDLCKLEITSNNITLHYYSIHGDLKKSIDCENITGSIIESNSSGPPVITCKENFYTYREKQFIIASASGTVGAYPFDTAIRTFAASHEFPVLNLIISTNKGCLLCRPVKKELNITSGYFATNLIPSSIVFIAESKFLMVEKRKAVLFFIDEIHVDVIKEFITEDVIVAVLPSSRNKFGLLEQNGRITLHSIN